MENQIYVPMKRIAIPLMRSNQLSMASDLVPRMVMRTREVTKVARKIIPKIVPPVERFWLRFRGPDEISHQ